MIVIIAQAIKNLRKKFGYTQKQVADLLGVDRSTYSYYELGRIKPDIKTVMKLAQVFGVHYTQILESEGINTLSDSSGSLSTQNDEDKLSMDFSELSQEEKNALVLFRMLSKEAKQEAYNFMCEKFKK